MIIGLYKKFEDKVQSLYHTIGEKISLALPASNLELTLGTYDGKSIPIQELPDYSIPAHFAKGKEGKKPKKIQEVKRGEGGYSLANRPKSVPKVRFLVAKYDITSSQAKAWLNRNKRKQKN